MTEPEPPRNDENTPFQAAILACVAGIADATGLLRFGTFVGLASGNTVLIGIALAQQDWAHALHTVGAIAAFLTGIACSALARHAGIRLVPVLTVEAAAIASAALLPDPAAAPVLGFGLGLQNAAVTRFAGATLNTAFITGDLQKIVTGTVARIVGRGGPPRGEPIGVLIWVYAGYLGGAVAGAAGNRWLDRPLLYVPPLLALALWRGPIRRRTA